MDLEVGDIDDNERKPSMLVWLFAKRKTKNDTVRKVRS